MKTLLWTILFLILAALGCSWLNSRYPGYILIDQFGYHVEVRAAVALFLALLLFGVLFLLFRFLGSLMRAPRDLRKANERRAVSKAHSSTEAGYAALISGDWKKAERQLMTNIDRNPTPLLNYLAAANAAHQRDDFDARDSYISKALEASPRDKLPIGLTKARLQYQSGQLDDAATTLRKVQKFAPRNPRVLRLITEVGRASGDWETVLGILPAARGAKALTADELEDLETEANRQVLALPAADSSGGGESLEDLKRRYDSLKSKKRSDPRVVEAYTRRLLEGGAHAEADKVLKNSIKRNWDSELVYLYGLVQSERPEASLKLAESWAKQHPNDPDLLLTLGRLAMQNKIWGKARSYLESAIASGGRDEAHRELGQLLEQLGETSEAMTTYRSGLIRMVSTNTTGAELLPAPVAATESDDSAPEESQS